MAVPHDEMPTGIPALVTDMADVQALITKVIDYAHGGHLASAEVLADEITANWIGIVDRIGNLRRPLAPAIADQSSPIHGVEAPAICSPALLALAAAHALPEYFEDPRDNG